MMIRAVKLLAALALLALTAIPGHAMVIDNPNEPFDYYAYPTGMLGLPEGERGILVTPEGGLSNGYSEIQFALGTKSTPLNQRVKTLLQGRIPVYQFSKKEGPVDYRFEMLGDSIDGKPSSKLFGLIRVQAVNLSNKIVRTAFDASIRFQAKTHRCVHIGFSPNWVYQVKGDSVLRDGQLIAVLAPSPAKTSIFPSPERDSEAIRYKFTQPPAKTLIFPTPERDSEAVRADYKFTLAPKEMKEFVFRLPEVVEDPAYAKVLRSVDYASHRASLISRWQKLFGQAMVLRIPEKKVEDTYYANLATLFIAADRNDKGLMPSVNEFQYCGFWLRDGAFIVRAFDVSGYRNFARETAEYFLNYQEKDGNFLSQPGQLDGWGETLWLFGKHYELSRDMAFVKKVYPSVQRAMAWLHETRLKTKAEGGISAGLLLRTVLTDNELVENGHIIGNDFWALGGVHGAILLAHAIGNTKDEAAFRTEYNDYHAAVLKALRYMVQKYGYISPALEEGGLDWGNMKSVWPSGVLKPNDPWVTKSLEKLYKNDITEGLMTYRAAYFEPPVHPGGATDNLHSYVGLDIPQTELLRGEQDKVLDYFYASLLHTSASHAASEMMRTGSRDFSDTNNLQPHGTFSGKFIDLLRNMLVREEDTTLHLGSCLSPTWLRPGKEIRVEHAPTNFGEMGFVIQSKKDGAVVQITPPVRNKPQRILLHLPTGFKVLSVEGNGYRGKDPLTGALSLEPDTKKISIHWKAPAEPYKSYDSTVSEFIKYYQQMMQKAEKKPVSK